MIFHIATETDWQAAQAEQTYQCASLSREGFIHCSTRLQVPEVAGRLFKGREDLVLLIIDPQRVPAKIIYENLEGGREQYPHIYGSIPCTAILRTHRLRPTPDGGFDWPA